MIAIGRDDIRRAVTLTDAIGAARSAFIALSQGRVIVPPRPHLETPNGISLVMPAFAADLGTVGMKLVTVTPSNAKSNRPVVQAIVLLVNEDTGTPVALIEGTYLTQLRTGAAIGLAADLLARKDARIVSVFGAGAMAQSSLAAVCSVRSVTEIRVVDPDPRRFDRLVGAVEDFTGAPCPPLRWCSAPSEALGDSDIIITATTSPTPVFPSEAVPSGAFIGALGAFTPTTRELDTRTIQRSRLIVDTRVGALAEAGEIVIPIQSGEYAADRIWAELGEVVLGLRPGRTTEGEIIVFKTVGNAMQDLVLATLVYERAKALGLGQAIAL